MSAPSGPMPRPVTPIFVPPAPRIDNRRLRGKVHSVRVVTGRPPADFGFILLILTIILAFTPLFLTVFIILAVCGTFAGAIGGSLIAAAVGWLLQKTHSYINIFAIAAFAYLFALLVIQFLSPRLNPVSTA